MKNRYCALVSTSKVVEVYMNANSVKGALGRVADQEGEEGDSWYEKPEFKDAKKLG